MRGQRAQVRRARSHRRFKLREGMAIGARVTLRGEDGEFLDRLVRIARPHPRLRGLNPGSFDGAATNRWGSRSRSSFRR